MGTSHFPEGLTFHLFLEASSSSVSNNKQWKGARGPLLNGRDNWALQTGYLNNTNVVSFLLISRFQCHPGKEAWHPENTQARAVSPTSNTYKVFPQLQLFLTLWQNQLGTLLKWHTLEQLRSPPTWAANHFTHLWFQLWMFSRLRWRALGKYRFPCPTSNLLVRLGAAVALIENGNPYF